ncbi:MAG: GspE/PulE family protein [Candidatus Omnitrophica bacterium]|nr:GspE/PulE family protein [Candidatus Omnitrophota bacterium]
MAHINRNIPAVNLNNYLIDSETVNSLPENLAKKYKVIPIFKVRDTVTLAMANPSDFMALDEIRAITGGINIQVVKAEEADILKAIEQYYNVSNSIEEIVENLLKTGIGFLQEEKLDLVKLQRIAEEPPVIKLVNLIIAQALKDNASDIHIEPEEDKVLVRLRIDGVLHPLVSFPRGLELPVIPRIKVVSGLDITERRKPQDGRFRVRLEEREVDLRISTFPVAFGEKVVVRILDRATAFLTMEKIGFSADIQKVYESLVVRPYGMILVTGPTGSGKTSTLYSSLVKLNSNEKNIVTLEDPREYLLEGINQGEVNSEIDFTFANGLKSILRQDPDIIMVGEIRDLETAQIAVRAALTGHLLLSTLHTNDAAGAITRLVDMGIEPFLISSSLICVLAQRLVRTICPHCKEKYQPQDEVYAKLGLDKNEKIPLYRGKGCLACRHTGFKGRIGIFELMVIDDSLRELIAGKRPTTEIKAKALSSGMRTLQQDGFEKVLKGITTFEEVIRVASDSL